MNALKNFTTGAVVSVTVCNSEHPLAKHASMSAKRIPNAVGMYYIRFKADEFVATYRSADHTLTLHEMSFAEFKRRWDERTLPHSEPIDIPETDKYIGNVLWRMLSAELEPLSRAGQKKEPAPSEVDKSSAIMTNTKVWCRRFEVECKGAKDFAIAEQLYPNSVRRGPIALAAARASNAYGVADSRTRLVIGCLAADLITHQLDHDGAEKDYSGVAMDAEAGAVWKKHEAVVRALAHSAWANRVKEKSTPSLTNMLLNAVRGK